ncbi:MAG: twin-arginine translocase subunit TatB [Nitrospirae bacterium]|nr:twin-arginine translocase subunit TatB [Nitrospirota bacterium]
MFDIGFQELVLIFVVALLVFGPKRLPEIGKSLGRGVAELKKAMNDMQATIREEEEKLKKEVPDITSDIKPFSENAGNAKPVENTGKDSEKSPT